MDTTTDHFTPLALRMRGKKIAKDKPVVCHLLLDIQQPIVPQYVQGILPKPLIDYYEETYLQLSYPDLLVQCEQFFSTFKILPEQVKEVGKKTQEQARSKIWFQQRAGRITASRLKSAVCTDVLHSHHCH